MYAEIAAYNILANTSAITTLVGSGATMKMYLGRRRQTTALPAILIQPNGIDPTDQKPDATGTGQGVSHLDTEDVIIFCYASTFTGANALAQAVRTALDKKLAGTYNGIVVQSVQFKSEDYFDEELDPETYVFEHMYRFRIIR